MVKHRNNQELIAANTVDKRVGELAKQSLTAAAANLPIAIWVASSRSNNSFQRAGELQAEAY